MIMRCWFCIICSLPLVLTGCVSTSKKPTILGSPGIVGAFVHPDQQALARALAHFAQANLLVYEQGQGSELALAAYQRAFDADPGNHDIASRIAVIALHRKDLPTAVAAMEASQHSAPDAYDRNADLAAIYQIANRDEEALRLYRRALDIDNSHAATTIAAAALYFRGDQVEPAISLLEQGFRSVDDPNLINIYLYEQGRRFVSNSAYAQARACFEALRAHEPSYRPAIDLILAELYSALGDDAKVIETLKAASELPDPDPDVYAALARAFHRQQRQADALDLLTQARLRFASDPDALFALGSVYSEMEFHKEVIAVLAEARQRLDAAPSPTEAERPPLSEGYYLILASAYDGLQEHETTEQLLAECLTAHPDSHRAMNFLAYLWAEQDKNLPKALKYSLKSVTFEPKNAAYIDTLGWIYYRMKKLELAWATLSKAYEIIGDDAEILLHLGDVQAALGNTEAAVKYWTQSVAIDPAPTNRAVQQIDAQSGMSGGDKP
ncbi:MAG TPA: hypothetical protein DCS43_08540 [Verrucomicrobia bacterium]|nr:hypothetical protein [Verrucomicrobiota bacterium]